MRRARVILILGIWVAILPYLGFPDSWKSVFFTLSGLIFVYLSYDIYRAIKANKKRKFDNFSENSDFGTDLNNK